MAYQSPPRIRFPPREVGRSVWVPHMESVEFDAVRVDVVAVGVALLDEA